MSSDEDDYMSDKFLGSSSADIRPGLPKRKADQHAFEQYKRKLKAQEVPSKAKQEAILREEGLQTAISSDNKGFQMLAKMGFKAGSSLGSKQTGIKEPINILVKADKAGLGKKVRPAVSVNQNKPRDTRDLEENYRKNVQIKKNAQRIRKYYFTAQSVCAKLDIDQKVADPVELFYWPRRFIKEQREKEKLKKKMQEDYNPHECSEDEEEEEEQEEDEEEEEEEVNEDKLRDIVIYLRASYYYCIYCGARGESEDDLNSFCPGPEYLDHQLE